MQKTRQEIVALILDYLKLSTNLVLDNITDTANLWEVNGVDSIEFYTFVAMLEEEFETDLDDKEILELNSIEELSSYLMELQANQ